ASATGSEVRRKWPRSTPGQAIAPLLLYTRRYTPVLSRIWVPFVAALGSPASWPPRPSSFPVKFAVIVAVVTRAALGVSRWPAAAWVPAGPAACGVAGAPTRGSRGAGHFLASWRRFTDQCRVARPEPPAVMGRARPGW